MLVLGLWKACAKLAAAGVAGQYVGPWFVGSVCEASSSGCRWSVYWSLVCGKACGKLAAAGVAGQYIGPWFVGSVSEASSSGCRWSVCWSLVCGKRVRSEQQRVSLVSMLVLGLWEACAKLAAAGVAGQYVGPWFVGSVSEASSSGCRWSVCWSLVCGKRVRS